MSHYTHFYKTIVVLLTSILAMSSIADEIDEATQKKLESLERRIQKLEAMIFPSSTSQTGDTRSNYSSPLEAWNTLRAGMRFAAVTAILGNPPSTEIGL